MQQRSGFRIPLPRTVFYGWWIVASALTLATIYSGFFFYDFTLFVTPIREDLPEVGNAINGAFFATSINSAIMSPVLGAIFDRRGPKMVAGGGLALGAIGFAIMGVMTEPWHLYIGFSLAGFGPIVFFSAAIPSVVNWFFRMRGRALGICMAGLGLGGFLTIPTLFVIEQIGWRNTFLVMAAVIAVLVPLMTIILRGTPEKYGMRPDGDAPTVTASGVTELAEPMYGLTFTQALRAPVFWFLGTLFFLAFWCIGALTVHQSPFMEAAGYSRTDAAFAVGAMAIITVVGRVLAGWMADATDPRRAAVLAFVLQAVGISAFALSNPDQNWYLILFLLAFSPGFGMITVLQAALLATYLGRRAFGVLQGILWTVTALAVSVSPTVATFADNSLGGMQNGFLMFGAFSAIGLILVYLVLPRPGIVRPRSGSIIPPPPQSTTTHS